MRDGLKVAQRAPLAAAVASGWLPPSGNPACPGRATFCGRADFRYYHEIINASGTGLGHCTFGLQDVYGNRLIIVTAGEVIEELNATAHVWNWYFAKEREA